MKVGVMSRLILHVAACVAYPFLNYCVYSLYHEFFGPMVSRGVNVGLAMQLLLFLLVLVNLMIICVQGLGRRIAMVVGMIAVALIYLLPYFPLRAIAFSVVGGGITLVAVLLSQPLQYWLYSFRERKT